MSLLRWYVKAVAPNGTPIAEPHVAGEWVKWADVVVALAALRRYSNADVDIECEPLDGWIRERDLDEVLAGGA